MGAPRPLPPPLPRARLLSGRGSARRAQQGAALAQGACLPAGGQTAPMSQTLEAVRHDMEQKTPATLRGFQRHDVLAIPLAPIALRDTPAAVAHLQEAMLGNRDTLDIASQGVETLGWP